MMFLEGRWDDAREFRNKHNFPFEGNTSEADYVWLPILFEGDKPIIKWFDEWKLSDFD